MLGKALGLMKKQKKTADRDPGAGRELPGEQAQLRGQRLDLSGCLPGAGDRHREQGQPGRAGP